MRPWPAVGLRVRASEQCEVLVCAAQRVAGLPGSTRAISNNFQASTAKGCKIQLTLPTTVSDGVARAPQPRRDHSHCSITSLTTSPLACCAMRRERIVFCHSGGPRAFMVGLCCCCRVLWWLWSIVRGSTDASGNDRDDRQQPWRQSSDPSRSQ